MAAGVDGEPYEWSVRLIDEPEAATAPAQDSAEAAPPEATERILAMVDRLLESDPNMGLPELLDAAGWVDRNDDGIREKEGRPFHFTATVRQGKIACS